MDIWHDAEGEPMDIWHDAQGEPMDIWYDAPGEPMQADKPTYYLDGKDKKVGEQMETIKANKANLVDFRNDPPGDVCRLMKVGAFNCKLIQSEGLCQCRYLAPQKCRRWFR